MHPPIAREERLPLMVAGLPSEQRDEISNHAAA